MRGASQSQSRAAPHTFHGDDVHALHGVHGAKAGVDGAVQDVVALPAGHHHCACPTAALPTPQLRARQPIACKAHTEDSPTIPATLATMPTEGMWQALRHHHTAEALRWHVPSRQH